MICVRAQVGEQRVTGVSQFKSHKFLCRAMQTFKSVAQGKQQSEEGWMRIEGW